MPYGYWSRRNWPTRCVDGALSGTEVAAQLGMPPEMIFKTLVTVGKSGEVGG